MVIKKFYLHRVDYMKKLVKTMPKVSRNGNMLSSRSSNEEAYFIDKTGALLFYDGKNSFFIGARNQEIIKRTKSNLEKIAGIQLTQI